MIVIEGSILVRDLAAARPHMQRMIEASRAEPGCVDYAYAVDLLDPHLVRISERWSDRAALAKHLRAPHLAEWRACWSAVGITDRSLRLYEAEPEET